MAFSYTQIRKIFKGVSWKNPVINLVLHALDPFDWIIRYIKGLGYLPVYSVRVRSNGVRGQFGGQRFAYYGTVLSRLLKRDALLTPGSHVFEIGCGCGRTALALTQILTDGNYTGMDIEKVSLETCRRNSLLKKNRFNFDLMDICNKVYNPLGKYSAESYVFPYQNNSFDVIFLVSVFTHMLPIDVSNYIKEISRMLRSNGRCLMSTFLMDHGHIWNDLSFPYEQKNCRVLQETFPEVAIGYYLKFFEEKFAKHKMFLTQEPLLGHWRHSPNFETSSEFPQDILIFSKKK